MTWVRLDDNFYTNPKFIDCSFEAVGLYVLGLALCSQHKTDGHLKRGAVPRLLAQTNGPIERAQEIAGELVDAGLWHEFDDGYGVNDYLEYQSSRAEIDARLSKDAERKRKARAAKKAKTVRTDSAETPDGSTPDVRSDSAETPGGVGSESALHITSHHITSPPSLSAQDAIAAPGLSTADVWIEAHNAGIPQRVISRARSDYEGSPDPTAGALADHIATRYTPAATKADLDDHYRKHGSPSLAQAPLKALAHRTGWANKRRHTTPAA